MLLSLKDTETGIKLNGKQEKNLRFANDLLTRHISEAQDNATHIEETCGKLCPTINAENLNNGNWIEERDTSKNQIPIPIPIYSN